MASFMAFFASLAASFAEFEASAIASFTASCTALEAAAAAAAAAAAVSSELTATTAGTRGPQIIIRTSSQTSMQSALPWQSSRHRLALCLAAARRRGGMVRLLRGAAALAHILLEDRELRLTERALRLGEVEVLAPLQQRPRVRGLQEHACCHERQHHQTLRHVSVRRVVGAVHPLEPGWRVCSSRIG